MESLEELRTVSRLEAAQQFLKNPGILEGIINEMQEKTTGTFFEGITSGIPGRISKRIPCLRKSQQESVKRFFTKIQKNSRRNRWRNDDYNAKKQSLQKSLKGSQEESYLSSIIHSTVPSTLTFYNILHITVYPNSLPHHLPSLFCNPHPTL